MRLIRKLVLLTLVVGGGVAAYAYWSGTGPRLGEKAVDLAAASARRGAARVATEVTEKAGDATEAVGHTLKDGALTAKIKSKMAIGPVATLTGVVASKDERRRAVQLARDTDGISRVVDKLEVKRQ